MHPLHETARHHPTPVARGARAARPLARALPVALAGAAVVSLASLGALLDAGRLTPVDLAMQRLALAVQSRPLHAAALGVTIAGGIVAMRLVALAAGAALWRPMGWRAGATIVATPWVAEACCDLVKRAYARPRPLGLGDGVDPTFAFPSAHSAVSMATCGAIAWLCWREGIMARPAAMLAGLGIPVIVGASRVLLNVHWTSDVAGGWCTGLAVAGMAIAVQSRGRIA